MRKLRELKTTPERGVDIGTVHAKKEKKCTVGYQSKADFMMTWIWKSGLKLIIFGLPADDSQFSLIFCKEIKSFFAFDI